MNVEQELQKDGIIVTEKIDTELILKITNNISKKIVDKFPNFNLSSDEIFSKLFTLNMYKAQIPEGMAEATYCYKNTSIYFNSHIADEDLEEFAIHECLHFLQEVKDDNNKITKMGLSNFSKFKTLGTGLNEAAVQYISAKIIGIEPDFEKYYDINIFTPSPSYYPVECALLNELIYFLGEDTLFKSTFFSTDDFKNEIINHTSKKIFDKIVTAFDNILKYEEKIIKLNNQLFNSKKAKKIENEISKYRENIKSTFIQVQNMIIQEFSDYEYNNISDLEQLEAFRRKLSNLKDIIGTTEDYDFFNNYYLETMNALEHKASILENDGLETALIYKSSSFFNLLNKIRSLVPSKKVHEK